MRFAGLHARNKTSLLTKCDFGRRSQKFMLETVLNIRRLLAPRWYLDYGLTGDRNRTLMAPFPERNSLKHPLSETALTLFMLGNLDGWKQIGHFPHGGPRNQNDQWSRRFFTSACGSIGSESC